jgi:hypothetical protein
VTPDPLLVQAVAQAIQGNASRLGLVWELTFATVVDGTTPAATAVTFDSDTTTIVPVVSLIGAKTAGDRVAVVSIPLGGQYIVGFLS